MLTSLPVCADAQAGLRAYLNAALTEIIRQALEKQNLSSRRETFKVFRVKIDKQQIMPENRLSQKY